MINEILDASLGDLESSILDQIVTMVNKFKTSDRDSSSFDGE